jgi:hypothetical protein
MLSKGELRRTVIPLIPAAAITEAAMMGRQNSDQASLFYKFRLEDRIPRGTCSEVSDQMKEAANGGGLPLFQCWGISSVCPAGRLGWVVRPQAGARKPESSCGRAIYQGTAFLTNHVIRGCSAHGDFVVRPQSHLCVPVSHSTNSVMLGMCAAACGRA